MPVYLLLQISCLSAYQVQLLFLCNFKRIVHSCYCSVTELFGFWSSTSEICLDVYCWFRSHYSVILNCVVYEFVSMALPYIAGVQNHSEEDVESRTVLVTNVCRTKRSLICFSLYFSCCHSLSSCQIYA